MKKLDENQILEIIKLYQDGMTPKDIGDKFGIMNNSVTRILRDRGVDRTQLKRVTEENIKIIIQRYTDGTSSEIIAKDLNIDGRTVCRILKRNNIEVRPTTRNAGKGKQK
jgi:DNA invertase Pin-like site-specific DNA recombinase